MVDGSELWWTPTGHTSANVSGSLWTQRDVGNVVRLKSLRPTYRRILSAGACGVLCRNGHRTNVPLASQNDTPLNDQQTPFLNGPLH